MNLRLFASGCVLGAVSALVTAHAVSQEHPGMPSPEEMKEMTEKWLETTQPGEFHEMLDNSVGTWSTLSRIWWSGPGSDPIETEGVAKRKWVLDRRFVLEEFSGKAMMPDLEQGGMEMKEVPWQGMGLFGFDKNRNMFVGTWADSLSTHLLTMKGTVSPDGTTFTYYGEMDEPMLGVVGRYVKYETKIVDPDTHVFAIYDLHAGPDYKVIEVTYRRK